MSATRCAVCETPVTGGWHFCPNCGTALGSSPRPPRSGMSGGLRSVLLAAATIALAGGIAVIVFVVGVGRASHKLNSALVPHPGRPAGYQGPAYPGMLIQDTVAGPSGVVAGMGETVMAGHLARRPSLLGPTLCADVSLANDSQETKNVGPAEWKLQGPDGTVQTFGLTGTLAGGQIAPGGAASGSVCFADVPRSGGFALLWQPLAFTAGRGVWLFTL